MTYQQGDNIMKMHDIRPALYRSFVFEMACVCSLALGVPAFGHGGGGDIAVFETNGKVDVGFAILDENDIEQIAFDPNDSVFQAVLTTVTPPFAPWMDYSSSEPGYDANEGDLPGSAEFQWNLLNIGHWNGEGSPSFTPLSSIQAGYSPNPWSQPTDSEGGLHAHSNFGLGDLGAGSTLPDGVYLAELTLSVETLQDSDPFYLVTLVDQLINSQANDDAIVAAAEQVGQLTRDYLNDPSAGEPVFGDKNFRFYANAIQHAESLVVPEPSSAWLILLSLTTLIRCR